MRLKSTNGICAALCALVCLAAVPARAQFSYTTNMDNTITITQYTGAGGDVTIPQYIAGLPVAIIGDWAFFQCSSLTSVEIPNTVTTIGEGAFASCSGLTNANIPSGVTTIDDWAFDSCSNLMSVEIPDSVIAIGDSAFAFTGLESVEIPDSVTIISDFVFCGCTNLISVEIPDSVTNIGDYAFTFCTDLTSVYIPGSVTSIGGQAFSYCTNLIGVVFFGDAPAVATDAFYGDSYCWAYYYEGTTGWGDEIGGCPTMPWGDIYYFIAPDDNISIIQYVGNESDLNIPETLNNHTVTSIGNGAFDGCSNLMNVTIPASVTNIDDYAFANCPGLSSVVFFGDAPTPGSNIFQGDDFCTVYYYADMSGWGAMYGGRPTVQWDISQFSYTTNMDNTITITQYTGAGGDVIIPKYIGGLPVAIIGDWAFDSCSNLTSVDIPDSVTAIGDDAFSFTGLASVDIPDSVTIIGDFVFFSCTNLTNVEIPDSVTNIGDFAFTLCTDLTSVYIPGSVTSIGNQAFSDCTNLTVVVFFGDAPAVATNAFYGDSDCWAYYYEGTTGWGDEIGGCPTAPWGDIYYFIAPDDNVSIVQYVGNENDLNIPETLNNHTVTSIGNGAFDGCSSLVNVTIPASVTNIDDYAFANCPGLSSVACFGNAPTVATNAFHGDNDCWVYYYEGTMGWGSTFGGRPTIQWDSPSQFSCTTNMENTITITGYSGDGGDVAIPKYIGGLPVTIIGDWAFDSCSNLTSVEIPNSVTAIGDWAFCVCTNLTNVDIPSSVTTIGDGAFCFTGLASVEIPDSVTAIGDWTFDSCSNLTNVDIPSSVTTIGDGAFYFTGLASVEIPDSVTNIGDYAFAYCTNLTSVVFGGDAPALGSYVFDGDNNCWVYYHEGTSGWGDTFGGRPTAPWGDFYYFIDPEGNVDIVQYVGNESDLNIPATLNSNVVTTIGAGAFMSCNFLTSVDIPDSVTTLGVGAFFSCTSLTNVDIPSSVTTIGDGAFADCSGLMNVDIPGSVTTIGDMAFTGCSGLMSVDIPGAVTTIGNSMFAGCSGLTSVYIPDSVTNIDDYAFTGCSGLSSIYIPDGVTNIANYAFSGCSGLKDAVFGGDAPALGTNVFVGDSTCTVYYYAGTFGWGSTYGGRPTVQWTNPSQLNYTTNLNNTITISGYTGSGGNVAIPGYIGGLPVSTIGNTAFLGCSGITSVMIPDSVTTIGSGAFSSCSSLASASIPDGVTAIEGGAFYNCRSLTSVNIPNSVTIIGPGAFSGCISLANVTTSFGSAITTIGDGAFSGCTSLVDVRFIGSTSTTIGSGAFSSCSSLKTVVTCCNANTSIGDYAFAGCSNLREAVLFGDTPSLGANVYIGDNNCTVFYLPFTSGWGSTFGGRPTQPTYPGTWIF